MDVEEHSQGRAQVGAQVRVEAEEVEEVQMRASEFTGATEHRIVRFPFLDPHIIVRRDDVRAYVAPDLYRAGDTVKAADPVPVPTP